MIDFEAMSIAELIGFRTSLEAAIEKRRSELEQQLAKLGGRTPTPTPPAAPAISPQNNSAKKSGSARKVKATYRHPQTGEEWSGRGRPARWLAAELASGKKREDFLA